jgi:4-phytase/acid phosphatase
MRILMIMAAALLAPVTALAASLPAAPTSDLKLERVVMLMRHSVRPPTKAQATPVGTTVQPWSSWTTPYGDLTPHGAEGARLMGVYSRTLLSSRGLLPTTGCAPAGEVVVWASGKSRAIKTAESFTEGLQPGCGVAVAHPDSEDNDPVFHPLSSGATLDGALALKAAQRLKPGVAAEVGLHAADFAVMQRVLGCDPATKAGCGLAQRPTTLTRVEGDGPNLEGALSIASTAGQTIMLEYVEGKPMDQVGWGRASKADIQAMLRFHPIKFLYEARAPYISERYAAPVAKRVLQALNGEGDTGRLTLLVGHDTNIASLAGFLNAHFTIADYPRDDPPPGGAMGFELLRDAGGHAFVRAFYTAQSMDQLRELQPLTAANPPAYAYFPIPGCGVKGDATLCTLEAFQKIVGGKLKAPARN